MPDARGNPGDRRPATKHGHPMMLLCQRACQRVTYSPRSANDEAVWFHFLRNPDNYAGSAVISESFFMKSRAPATSSSGGDQEAKIVSSPTKGPFVVSWITSASDRNTSV